MNFKLYTILLVVSLIACDKATQNTEDNKPEINTGEPSATEIKNIKYTDYALGSDASKLLIDWKKFQELNIQMGYLKEGDLSFFKNERLEVKSLFDSLKVGLPDTLAVKPIISRFAVLETQALKLHNNLSMDNMAKATKLSSIEEVLVAFGHLNLQINKKLEFDANEYYKP